MKEMRKLKIDEEFKAMFEELETEEFDLLEESIIKEGCREPLIVWKEEGILLDGHNRKKICEDRKIPYEIKYINPPNRDAAKVWIYQNQTGRRNLTDNTLILGKLRNLTKREGGNPNRGDSVSPLKKSESELAKEKGVSTRTVRRSAKLANSVDKLKSLDPEIEKKVNSKEVSHRAVISAAKAVEADPAEAKLILAGKRLEYTGERRAVEDLPKNISNRAIDILMRIPEDDPEWEKALKDVVHWIRARLKIKKEEQERNGK